MTMDVMQKRIEELERTLRLACVAINDTNNCRGNCAKCEIRKVLKGADHER